MCKKVRKGAVFGAERERKMANRIKELRGELHMTQAGFGEVLGLTQETVSCYESGKIYPSFPQLCRMAELFDASLDYIMGLSPVRCPRQTSERGALLEQLRELENRMDMEKLAQLVDYAKSQVEA